MNEYIARTSGGTRTGDVEAKTDGFCNPENPDDSSSAVHCVQHAPELCFADTNHDWWGAHKQWRYGRMDGFFATNDQKAEGKFAPELMNGDRALTFYDDSDLPFYYSLASTFAIGDHYFSSVLGPTYPNRDFLYAATSRGYTYDSGVTSTDYPFGDGYDAKSPELLFDLLEAHGISWGIYGDNHVGPVPVPEIAGVASTIGPKGVLSRWGFWTFRKFHSMDDFYEDAKKGKLPQVAFVDPALHGGTQATNDEHPPNDVQMGEKFTSDVVSGLMRSKTWGHVALFVTWDENGGIYDHVEPPPACPPDDSPLKVGGDARDDADYVAAHPGERFDRYGFRVPVLVVSPWVKAQYVSHRVYDHTSILRFIETRFDLPALTARDANADAMLDFFDFGAPSFAAPPALVASAFDQDPAGAQARVDACRKKFGN